MTAALHSEHVHSALQSGRSRRVGPWEVVPSGRTLRVYHYAHRLIRVVWPTRADVAGLLGQMPDDAIPTLYAYPRPGYGFSRTDLDAIYMVRSVTNARYANEEDIHLPRGMGGRSPYYELAPREIGYGVTRVLHRFPERRE